MDDIESAKVAKAFNTARVMKWISTPLSLIAIIIAVFLGSFIHFFIGLGFLLLSWVIIFSFGYKNARCPVCDQLWWSWLSLIAVAPWWTVALGTTEVEDELESMKCRKCGLEIGIHLRKQ